MCVIRAIVQLFASHCVEKRCVIFERTFSADPNYLGFRVIFREFGDQNVKRVSDSAAFIMHDVILAAYRCPNQPLAWKLWIDNGVGRVPLFTRFCESAIITGAKCDDCGWNEPGESAMNPATLCDPPPKALSHPRSTGSEPRRRR